MIKQNIYIVLIALFLVACKQEPNQVAEEVSIVEDQDIIINSIGVQLSPKVKESISDWGTFSMLTEMIERYTSITKSQALTDAKEISNMTKGIIDMVQIDLLDRPDMMIRFNVLYNQALRLDDMATIPSISDDEVRAEVLKLLEAFSSVNDKMNSIYKIDDFEKRFANDSGNVEIKPIEFRNDIRLKAMKKYENSRN